jgi:hypothetical protein
MIKRYLALAMAAVVAVAAVLIGATSYDRNGKAFPWLPFATNAGGQTTLMFGMPPPLEFQSHADCKASIAHFLQSDSPGASAYRAPYGCAYQGNSFLYVYVVNWLHDGNLLDGCLAKHIVSATDSGDESLYRPTVLVPGRPESGATWYCVARWPGAAESRAQTIAQAAEIRAQTTVRQVAVCQQHNTGWEHVPVMYLEAHIADFNADCAELGIKTDCKVVTKHKPKPPGEAVDPDPYVELGRQILRESFEVTC